VAESSIEDFLQKEWQNYPPSEWPNLLNGLIESLHDSRPDGAAKESSGNGELSRLLSLLLGQKVSTADFCSEEFLEKLGQSLNTIFDMLNQIVKVIHTTLLGRKEEMETIRLIIGSTLKGEESSESLQNYLNQIRGAFLMSHRAFQQAAQKTICDILRELDPERISKLGEGGLGFSPFHKGKLYEIYKEEFIKCKGWVESGRFIEEMLREFEKNCQEIYQSGHGRCS